LGIGIAFIPAIVAVSFYFEKRRSIAIGIAVCGTGIGTFVIAPLTNVLLSEYSWKGTVLIEAAILLNCIACGMVFRPLNIRSETRQAEILVKEIVPATLSGAEDAPGTSVSTLESPDASRDVECNEEGSGKSHKSTVTRTPSTTSAGLSLHNDMFYTSSFHHIPQCHDEHEENVGNNTASLTEQLITWLDKHWPTSTINITNRQQDRQPANRQQEMGIMEADNVELPPVWATLPRNVGCATRHSDWQKPAALYVASVTLCKSRSLDSIPQYHDERDYHVHTMPPPQPESQQSSSLLAKTDIAMANDGETLNVMECEKRSTIVKNASNLEQSQSSSASSLDVRSCESEKSMQEQDDTATVEVEYEQPEMKDSSAANTKHMRAALSRYVTRSRRHSESDKPALSCKLSMQLAEPLIQKNVFYTGSLDQIPLCEDENDHNMASLKEQRESGLSRSHPAEINHTNVKEEKANIFAGKQQKLKSNSFELSETPATWSPGVPCRRRYSKSTRQRSRSLSPLPPQLKQQCQVKYGDYVHSTTLLKEPQEPQSDNSWTVMTPANMVKSAEQRIIVKSASNCELPQTSAQSSRDVESWQRLIDSQTSPVSRASPEHLTIPKLHHNAFYTNSLDQTPQYPANKVDEHDQSMSSVKEPQKDCNIQEEERTPSNQVETMKEKSTSHVDLLTQTSAASTPVVERKQRFIKVKRPAMLHAPSTRMAGLRSHKNVLRTQSFRQNLQYRAEHDDYSSSATSPTEQLQRQSDETGHMTDDDNRKPTDAIGTELPEMKDKSSLNLDLTQTSAASTPAVERKQHFIKVKKPATSQTPSSRLAGLRFQSFRRIPQYRTSHDDYRGSRTSLTDQQERQSNRSWRETISISNERNKKPTNVVESGEPRMKVKSASTVDLAHIYAAPTLNATRRRRLSDSEKSTKSSKSALSRISRISRTSLKHFADRMTEPELFYAISLEHIPQYPVDSESDYFSVTSVASQSDKHWVENISSAKRMRQRVSELMICRLFVDSVFILFVLSTLLTGVGFVVPYVFLPNRGLRLGFDSNQSSWLISAVGISNTVGRFVFGFIASIEHVNALMLYNSMLIICGICSVLSVLLTTFPLQICYALCFGFLSSTSSYVIHPSTCTCNFLSVVCRNNF